MVSLFQNRSLGQMCALTTCLALSAVACNKVKDDVPTDQAGLQAQAAEAARTKARAEAAGEAARLEAVVAEFVATSPMSVEGELKAYAARVDPESGEESMQVVCASLGEARRGAEGLEEEDEWPEGKGEEPEAACLKSVFEGFDENWKASTALVLTSGDGMTAHWASLHLWKVQTAQKLSTAGTADLLQQSASLRVAEDQKRLADTKKYHVADEVRCVTATSKFDRPGRPNTTIAYHFAASDTVHVRCFFPAKLSAVTKGKTSPSLHGEAAVMAIVGEGSTEPMTVPIELKKVSKQDYADFSFPVADTVGDARGGAFTISIVVRETLPAEEEGGEPTFNDERSDVVASFGG